MIDEKCFEKIVADLYAKAKNNEDREAYLSLKEYGISASSESTSKFLKHLLDVGVISDGKVDGKGLIKCTVTIE